MSNTALYFMRKLCHTFVMLEVLIWWIQSAHFYSGCLEARMYYVSPQLIQAFRWEKALEGACQ